MRTAVLEPSHRAICFDHGRITFTVQFSMAIPIRGPITMNDGRTGEAMRLAMFIGPFLAAIGPDHGWFRHARGCLASMKRVCLPHRGSSIRLPCVALVWSNCKRLVDTKLQREAVIIYPPKRGRTQMDNYLIDDDPGFPASCRWGYVDRRLLITPRPLTPA